jgi:hypothetical protein
MIRKLAPDDLYRRCDAEQFPFSTTDDITVVGGTIGQERALRSLDFGLGVASKGFNIFALVSLARKDGYVKTMLLDKASGAGATRLVLRL